MFQRTLVKQTRSLRPRALPISSLISKPQFHAVSSRLPAPGRARVLSRWYSSSSPLLQQQQSESVKEDGSATDAAAANGSATEQGKSPEQGENPMQKELDAAKKEVIDLKDKYVRQVAEYRNLQERTKREMQSARDFALQRFAKDLIESIDNLDLALSNVKPETIAEPSESSSSTSSSPSSSSAAAGGDASTASADAPASAATELRNLYNGLKMTESVLLSTLKKHGLERFDPSETNEKFNPNLHDATFQTPVPDKEDGTVFYTTQKGFSLNGRVLRAAKVGVVKNS